MGNVVYGINISVDGCFDHTFANPDEEIMDYFTNLIQDADVIVYGRKTYELMVPYWPDAAKAQSGTRAELDFAQAFTATDKIVFSKTLGTVKGNSRIIRDNPEEEIRKLKQQPGTKISIGGVTLPSQLIAAGLVDEFYFVVHPVIVGKGARLFDRIGLPEQLNLKLTEAKIFKSGAVGLHYLKP
ncbi:hypothetical protein BEL04_18565 [Mucilaginibacter sp. PPCGB 2223]|uniref:dihydrofolate reductase family protein n=1 Tax=Mucilaginibacter sp. PPCGB 2223 TaxID=1886027 RepID=UPI0008266EBB|nr:dihydrofolate reductase family protein [Mucilaginibacter sp. PPCGB 2223]OCX50740.1 hypothetical protein BEL04_18565 [Mucilaginibacter sp. PPCGB 2223]